MKALNHCVNDLNPIHPPSAVLCKQCFEALDAKMEALLGTFPVVEEEEEAP